MFNYDGCSIEYNDKQAYMYCIFLKYNFESGKCFGIFEEKNIMKVKLFSYRDLFDNNHDKYHSFYSPLSV